MANNQDEYTRVSDEAIKNVRDNVICTLIGYQNEIGHHQPNDPAYAAYQKVMDMIQHEYGPLMGPLKNKERD